MSDIQSEAGRAAGEVGRPARRWPMPVSRIGDGFGPWRLAAAVAFEREMEAGRGFLWLPVLAGVGILAYFALPVEPSLAALLLLLSVLSLCAWRLRRRAGAFRLFVALAAVVAGVTVVTLRTAIVAAPVLPREMTVSVTGWISAREASAGGGARVRLEVKDIEGIPANRTPPSVRVTVRAGGDGLRVGDAVSMLARLRPPGGPVMPGGYDFGRGNFYDGLGASGFAYGRAKAADIGPPPLGVALRAPLAELRETLRQRVVAVLPGDTGEIAAALIMGDQRGISDRAQEAMRASGLGHVLSISGLHMALVAGSVFWLLRALFALSPTLALTRPIRKWSAAGALMVATFYLAISGAEVAAQRSYIMLVVILSAVMLDRRAITVRNVAIAALVVLALEPESVLTASFQMSFAATLALVAGYEAIARRADRAVDLAAASSGVVGRARRATSGLTLTSVIAGLATAPFAIYHFQRAAPLSLLANLAAMPVIGILVMPMALFAVLLMPFGLEHLPLMFMGWGIDWMLAVGETTAAWSAGWGGIPAIPAFSLLLVVAGFLWLCLWGERWRLAGIVPMLLAVPVAMAASHPDILVEADGRVAAVRGADGRYRIVNPKADRFAAEYWLRADADTRSLDDDSIGDGIACDAAGCVVRLPDGAVVAVGVSAEAFADDCRLAAVIVSRFQAPEWCDRPDVVIDRVALTRGAHALYRIPGDADGDQPRFRVETTLPPADRRRPFMPPGQ